MVVGEIKVGGKRRLAHHDGCTQAFLGMEGGGEGRAEEGRGGGEEGQIQLEMGGG